MKKLILVISCLFLIQQISKSQPICEPDVAIGQAYLYPAKLPFAMAGYYYSQVLTFRVPKDTVVIYQSIEVPATVDSGRVLYIGGIPPGYAFACNVPTCTWPGGSLGCALLQGVSDSVGSAVGEYPIKVYIGTWFKAAATSFYRIDSSSSYTFKVLPYNGGFEISKTEILKVFPNPVSGKLNIELRDITSDNNVLTVYDITGKVAFHKLFNKPDTFLTTESLDVSQLPKGMYLVLLQTEQGNKQQRVIVE
jgi:hypothetical protein